MNLCRIKRTIDSEKLHPPFHCHLSVYNVFIHHALILSSQPLYLLYTDSSFNLLSAATHIISFLHLPAPFLPLQCSLYLCAYFLNFFIYLYYMYIQQFVLYLSFHYYKSFKVCTFRILADVMKVLQNCSSCMAPMGMLCRSCKFLQEEKPCINI